MKTQVSEFDSSEILSEELSLRSGLDVTFVQRGKIADALLKSLRSIFDKHWEGLPWDLYDVRKKKAHYAVLHDGELGRLDAMAQSIAIKKYYENIDVRGYKIVSDAIDRLRKYPHHDAVIDAMQPDRKKSHTRFIASFNKDPGWTYEKAEVGGGVFVQNTYDGDVRSATRVYESLPDDIASAKEFRAYMDVLVDVVLRDRPNATKLEVDVWFMSQTARRNQPGDNAPEGYHQDGSHYLSNMVIRRDIEISGCESVVYHRDLETGEMGEVNRYTLAPGEHQDMRDIGTDMWHDITPSMVDENETGPGHRRDILGADITILEPRPRDIKEIRDVYAGVDPKLVEAYRAIIAGGDRYLAQANAYDDYRSLDMYRLARESHEKAKEFQKENSLPEPDDFVKLTDTNGQKFACQDLDQSISKIREIEETIVNRGKMWHKLIHSERVKSHTAPLVEKFRYYYPDGYQSDERKFEFHDPSGGEMRYFEDRLKEHLTKPDGASELKAAEESILPQLVRSLGRIPSIVEVFREYEWQAIFREIEGRAEEVSLVAGADRAESVWVGLTARVLDRYASDGVVFMAGLGSGLMSKELTVLGCKDQLIVEGDSKTANTLGADIMSTTPRARVVEGSWRKVLDVEVQKGHKYEAVVVDFMPQDQEESLGLGYRSIKPGGIMTYRPHVKYIAEETLSILNGLGVPQSSIHYTIESFDATKRPAGYRPTDLVAVPWIQKPLLEDEAKARKLEEEYWAKRGS